MKTPMFALAVLALLGTAACGSATPTEDPAMIQASAVAAANTIVALTQAAVPLPRPLPTPRPSPTPLPSPTLIELPTLPFGGPTQPFTLPTQPGAPTTSANACNAPMAPKPEGPVATVRIMNNTGGTVVLSLYLNKTEFGECGYRGFNLMAHGSQTVSDLPQGCYFGGAFVTSPKAQTKSFGSGCIMGDRGTVSIGPEVISIAGN